MLSLLKDLTNLPGVSGDEVRTHSYLKEKLSSIGRVETTTLGSLLCYLPCENENAPTIMLEAHADRIGFSVRKIREDGYLTLSRCGGIDIRGVLGSEVVLTNEKGTFRGIICSLNEKTEKKIPVPVDQLFADMRMSKEQIRENIHTGDRLYLPGNFHALLNNNVSASALDDRAGCAAIIRAGELLKDFKKAKIVLCFSSQEEVGGVGASVASHIVDPDYAVAVDVSFATTPLEDKNETFTLGTGILIGYGPTISRSFSNLMVETAKENNIPYVEEVMGGSTGTDADSILSSGSGAITSLLSIGQRYMHTPVEIINSEDVENTALLISKVVEKLI